MNENVNTDNDEIEIDLGEVFHVLAHWAWLILLVGVALGTAGYCFSRFVLPEEYESTTSIYVLDRSSNQDDSSQMTYSDLQVSSQLTADYQELIKSRYVIEKVIDNLGLADQGFTYDTLYDAITVETPDNTHILEVTVTDTDPERAQQICNEVREVAAEHIKNVMSIDAVNVVDEANLPTEKSAPSNSKWAAICAIIGMLAVAIVVIVRYISDDTIKTSDDVEKYLSLYTLAVIPLDEEFASHSVEAQKKKGKKKKKSSSSSGSSHSSSHSGSSSGQSSSEEHHHHHHSTAEEGAAAAAAPRQSAAERRKAAEQRTGQNAESAGKSAETASNQPAVKNEDRIRNEANVQVQDIDLSTGMGGDDAQSDDDIITIE